jgi:dihydroneopterin aldolase|tara:strand:+ start:4054 stop:4404 length:351 start_codon:yes stop_codon:yes gene_type:complete
MKDIISITEIEVKCQIGVPNEERSVPQRLLISLELEKEILTAAQSDDLTKTIDYHAVWLCVKNICDEKERRLIETLAEEIAGEILREFSPETVRVEIRKFILPQTRHVAVRIERRA